MAEESLRRIIRRRRHNIRRRREHAEALTTTIRVEGSQDESKQGFKIWLHNISEMVLFYDTIEASNEIR